MVCCGRYKDDPGCGTWIGTFRTSSKKIPVSKKKAKQEAEAIAAANENVPEDGTRVDGFYFFNSVGWFMVDLQYFFSCLKPFRQLIFLKYTPVLDF